MSWDGSRGLKKLPGDPPVSSCFTSFMVSSNSVTTETSMPSALASRMRSSTARALPESMACTHMFQSRSSGSSSKNELSSGGVLGRPPGSPVEFACSGGVLGPLRSRYIRCTRSRLVQSLQHSTASACSNQVSKLSRSPSWTACIKHVNMICASSCVHNSPMSLPIASDSTAGSNLRRATHDSRNSSPPQKADAPCMSRRYTAKAWCPGLRLDAHLP
mmetsp:Transcript_103790/g.332602  ORF Transcript_103790/g.332602 Transcript_103790/m.332602 type:complete len:217 (+) Transcript_103790:1246-1896(+)